MSQTIRQIAEALNADAVGALDLEINGLAEPAKAGPDRLALAMSPKFAEGLAAGHARAAVLAPGMDWQAYGLEAAIIAPRPRFAMAGLTSALDSGPELDPGIHPSAVIHPSAEIGEGSAIGPFVVIGRSVVVGARARIGAHCSIAHEAVVGNDVLLHPGVRIGHRVRVGDRLIAQPGAMIGTDGFSFVTPEKSQVETARQSLGKNDQAVEPQSWTRIHSLGAVWIGDGIGERDFTIEVISWCVDPTVGVITGDGTGGDSEVVDIELAELGFRI